MSAQAIYYLSQEAPPLEIFWREDGTLIDFSDPAWVFVVTVQKKGQAATFTKTTGITGHFSTGIGPSATPNVIVAWTNELDTLTPGRWVLELAAHVGAAPARQFFGDLIIRAAGPAHGYCETTDLLYNGDTQVMVDEQLYVDMAADEMNARLGRLYVVPVDVNAPLVADWVGLELKKINMLIATGRLQQALANGDRATYEYGKSLIDEGKMCLEVLMGGSLEGVKKADGTFQVSAPGGRNPDVQSGVTAFEDFAMRNRPRTWYHPGDANVRRWY